MVIEYLAYQLIDGYKSGDGNVTTFLNHYDFYLVPFHNPDGKQCSSNYLLVTNFI
jgi:murein tripeptide amidase MpaA